MKARSYTYIFIILIGLYTLLSLVPPPDSRTITQYHLSAVHARLLSISVVLPVIAIWLIAMYGFMRLKDYALLIKDSADGRAFNTISTGVLFLALGSPVASVVNAGTNLLVRSHDNWLPTSTVINNYIGLITMAVGLFFIARGAENLVSLVRKRPNQREQHILVLLFIMLSSFFTYFIITRQSQNPSVPRIYYMPNILVLITLAIPYLYFWYRGLLGAYYLHHYQKHIKGQVYKGSLSLVAWGIATIIASSILIRLLVTLSSRISSLSLRPLLLLVYGLLIIAAMGYILIALGAKKLRRIEEV